MKMNPEIKQRWIEALLSKKYKQGRFYLRREDNYCCLGVLCDLKEDTEWFKPKEVSTVFLHNSQIDFPSEAVIKWAGLDSSAMSELADLNDGHGLSFEEIAEWIRVNL
jgi:hypothetical protein